MNHAHILYTVITGLFIYLQETYTFFENISYTTYRHILDKRSKIKRRTIGICHALAIRSCFVWDGMCDRSLQAFPPGPWHASLCTWHATIYGSIFRHDGYAATLGDGKLNLHKGLCVILSWRVSSGSLMLFGAVSWDATKTMLDWNWSVEHVNCYGNWRVVGLWVSYWLKGMFNSRYWWGIGRRLQSWMLLQS